MVKKIIVLSLASGFGSGYSPIAPGTAGSVIAALLYMLAQVSDISLKAGVAVTISLTIASFPIAHIAGKIYGYHDDRRIVIDEFAGFFTAAFFFHPADVKELIYIFFAFRFFDIVKPFPLGWIDRNLRNGFGCVLDDLLAGMYAAGGIIFIKEFIL